MRIRLSGVSVVHPRAPLSGSAPSARESCRCGTPPAGARGGQPGAPRASPRPGACAARTGRRRCRAEAVPRRSIGVVRMVAVGGPGAGDHDPPDTCLHARGEHVRGPGDIDAVLLLDVAAGIDDGCQMHDRVDRVPSQERARPAESVTSSVSSMMPSRGALRRRSPQTTSSTSSRAARAAATCEPRNPLPPVMSTRGIRRPPPSCGRSRRRTRSLFVFWCAAPRARRARGRR